MTMLPKKRPETLGGYIVHNVPFPKELTPEALEWLKQMTPIQIEQPYSITYLHSYAQDSPWFAGLTNKKLLASQDVETGYTYATPRGHDMYTGAETNWIDITDRHAEVHAFTVCHFGSEEFLAETPFVLIQVEFEGVDSYCLQSPNFPISQSPNFPIPQFPSFPIYHLLITNCLCPHEKTFP
ncbi:MAG: hypothetical protein B5M51_07105 [Anaerolinea sp. 4484_236]|nr:MAG: hypothetical protein B5M51_07105 [Anaerolinea sp. 4484_236]